MDDRSLGGRFWLGLVAAAVGLAVAGFVMFLILDRAFYRWGIFGTLFGLAIVLLLGAWVYDRRAVKKARAEFGS
jgi:hypothetical protein